MIRNENFKDLEIFLGEVSQQKNSQELQFYRKFLPFFIRAEISKLQNTLKQILDNFIKLQEQDPSVFQNEIICSFIFSLLLKDKDLLTASEKILKEITNKTQNLQILEALAEYYNKEKKYADAAQVYERILKEVPNSNKYKFKLAYFYSNSDINRAEQLLSGLEIEELITDYNIL